MNKLFYNYDISILFFGQICLLYAMLNANLLCVIIQAPLLVLFKIAFRFVFNYLCTFLR